MSTSAPALDFAAEPLDPVAVRVLGALVEKEFTTPDNYPLSLNALTAACNQASNRDPVLDLDGAAVMGGLRDLVRRSLAREVHRSDSRVKRYRHLLGDSLHLHAPEQAVLCVLLLRGPQTLGEIKGRTTRMAEFIDLSHVEITLQGLIGYEPPLAVQLARQPGQKDARYAHLLAGQPQPVAPSASAARSVPPEPSPPQQERLAALEAEVAALHAELAAVRAELDAFRREFQ